MSNGIPTGQEYYEGRRESVAELIEAAQSDDWDKRDEASEALDEYPLSVDVEKHVVVVLGTGGPHDEIDYNVTNGQARYNYYWGSERFEHPIYSGDPLYQLAERYAELYDTGE